MVRKDPGLSSARFHDGGLVEGLYVTGDFASGRFINLGGVKRQVVHDFTWAVNNDFLAGTNVADYLKNLG